MPEATVVTSVPATPIPVRSMQVPVAVKPPVPPELQGLVFEPGPAPAMQQLSGSRSLQSASVESVVKSSVCGKETISVSVPELNVPSGSGHMNKRSQVVVKTGMLTIALAVPELQVSAAAFPTVTLTCTLLSAPGVQLVWGSEQIVGELVSPRSTMVKSDPPSESMRPTPQPVCWTLVVKPSAGMQKAGAPKPPGKGTTVWCTQSASPAPTS